MGKKKSLTESEEFEGWLHWQNKWRHFTRNNPRNTNYCYSKLIELVGMDNWEHLPAYYRNEWESSRWSFDRMYGFIKSWDIEELTKKAKIAKEGADEKKEQLKDPAEMLESVTKTLEEVIKIYKEEYEKWNIEKVKELSDKLADYIKKYNVCT